MANMDKQIRKIKNIGHFTLALAANIKYSFTSRGMTIIGVTGTDGKTTTANLIYHILRNGGKKVAIISTLGAVIDEKTYETGFHVTTPSPFAIQKYIKLAHKKGCTHVVLEVTSHAIDQHRTWGIRFGIGVLTNITHEHLDYHKSYENYAATKIKLLQNSKVSVINSSSEWFKKAISILPKGSIVSYSLYGDSKKDITLKSLPFQLKTKLIGNFNLENILAATCVALILNIDPVSIGRSIASFDAPIGRQEVFRAKNGVNLIVDFAHTANAFEKILSEVRKITKGKIIHVFGAAGERDYSKRAMMGKVASLYDDLIVLTSEDNRSENVEDINRQIREGISSEKEVSEIVDRGGAIEFAFSKAQNGDTVIVTGKGHERTMNLGNGEEVWSDQEKVRKLIGET